ncbi:MAG: ABC transporter ATP-binding protein [Chloroflexi bacterium]|nr:ABC transporter ATP-binding protein [Chloroflexota bacterium]
MLLLAATMLIGISLLDLAGPAIVKAGIDGHIASGDVAGLYQLVALYVVVLGTAFALRYGQTIALNLAGQRAMHDLRVQIFERLERQSLQFFDRRPVGALITRLTNDVEALNEFLTAGLLSVVSDLLTLVAISIALALLNWQLALLTFSVLIPLTIAVNLLRQAMRAAFREIRLRLSRLNAHLAESITGMQVIQLFNSEGDRRRSFQTLNDSYLDANVRSIFYFSLFHPVVSLLGSLAVAGVVWYGGGQVVAAALTMGGLVAYLQYVDRFFGPIRDLAEKINILQSAIAASERIFDLIDTGVTVRDPATPVEPPPFQGEVVFDDVWFAYEPDNWVLKNVSFTVRPGERVALVGATGAGKTSVVSLLSRFYDVQRGSVRFDGLDVRQWRQSDLRARIAAIPQNPFLFAGTISRNIRLLNDTIGDDQVQQAANRASADRFVERLPGRYGWEVQERGAGLSVGEKQLLSFARAIACNPRSILVLDEATASVDSETEALVQSALGHLMEGRTSLVVAHRLSTIRRADRILVFHHGSLVEEGTHSQLVARDGYYAHLVALQDGSMLLDDTETPAGNVRR